MTRPRSFVPLLVCCTILAAASPATWSDDPANPVVPLYLEQLDDPRSEIVPREDPTARTAGLRIPQGSYVSVQVNVDALGQNIVGDAGNEPSIAVNPTNPNNIVIGWRQFDTITSNFRQAGRAHSMDRGQTWTFPGVLTPGLFRSDPVLDTDSAGNFYYQSLKSSFLMDVFRSTDGGATWGAPIASFGGDKNWMVVDKSGSIGDGHIYGIWREPFGCCGPSVFTRSTDGGTSYESPVPVSRSPGLGTMAVGPAGELYVTGIDEVSGGLSSFVAVRSLSARNAAQTSTFIDESVGMGGNLIFGGPPNPGGLLGQANIAVDHSLTPSRGFVYLLSTVDPVPAFGLQPAAVHIRRSEDGGSSWFNPVVVNDDPTTNGAWHWLAAHSVAPNGRIDVIWNDTRNSGFSVLSQLFYSYSYDKGATWSPNVAVSPEFNSTVGWPSQNKIGDYSTIISNTAAADVAYAATFNGEQDVYYVRVFPDCNTNGTSDVEDVTGTSEDCNGNFIPDECETETGCFSAGLIPNGSDEDDVPLLIGKLPGGQVELSWGASCKTGDTDYGIYEGPIGSFSDRVARTCTTGGNTMEQITPGGGNRFFLVVPHNTIHEGSYGTDSSGNERPSAQLSSCASQLIGECLGIGGF